jgi:hypothetical protein
VLGGGFVSWGWPRLELMKRAAAILALLLIALPTWPGSGLSTAARPTSTTIRSNTNPTDTIQGGER